MTGAAQTPESEQDHDVVVLTLGDDEDFYASQQFIQWLTRSYAVSSDNASLEALRAYDEEQVGNVLLRRVGLLHVMGHGDPYGNLYGKRLRLPGSRRFRLGRMERWVRRWHIHPRIDCVLLDACETFSDDWIEGLRSLLDPHGPHRAMVFIGTRRKVGWDEATTYTSAFYTALLRRPFPPATSPALRRRALMDAHARANDAYRLIRGGASPFRAVVIEA